MRRTVVALALVLSILSTPAMAAPAEEAPIGAPGSHTHYVITGNGRCVSIDAVAFEQEARGLHQGATTSGLDRGPSHGSCP
jgi:uncharacterized protein involved in high-affinity Fe2+ transport